MIHYDNLFLQTNYVAGLYVYYFADYSAVGVGEIGGLVSIDTYFFLF